MEYLKDIKVIHLEQIDSTNKYAKTLISNCYETPTLIYADYQIEGRGRLGRTFISNSGKGIYMTLLFKSMYEMSDISKFTGYTSCIVSHAIDELTGLNTKIKWVNDIYVNNKKLCGILTESVIKNNECYIIVGIGINMLSQKFDPDLVNKVTTIEDETNIQYDFNKLIKQITNDFFLNINMIKTKEYIKTYKEKSNVIGKHVEVNVGGKIIIGRAVDIDENGELIVNCEEKDIKIFSGEITKLNLKDE